MARGRKKSEMLQGSPRQRLPASAPLTLQSILREIKRLQNSQQAASDQTHSYLRDILNSESSQSNAPAGRQEDAEVETFGFPDTDSPPEGIAELPVELSHIREEIQRSYLVLQSTDADEERASCSAEVWQRAVRFLAQNAWWAFVRLRCRIDAPRILPGPDGSIDLHWDYPEYELLINVPIQPSNSAGFYGDDRKELTIKGKVNLNSFNNGLLLFLTEHR